MEDRVVSWVVRVLWFATAFTVWPAISAGLQHAAGPVRTAAAVGGWAVWVGVLVATLVPVPTTLTVLRCAAPGALAAVVAAAYTGHPSAAALAVGVAWSVLATAVVFLPATARLCANGPAYVNERRFPLAPPGALLVGPIEAAWALLVGLPTAGVLLLADERWLLGGVLTAVALPVAVVAARALHGLSRRWLVFVPAGVVVHDPMSLDDPVLFPRNTIESLAPGRDGVDLTLGAARPALELRLREECRLTVLRRRTREDVPVRSLCVAPTTPGRVLAYAAAHHIPVGRAQRAVPPPKTTSPS